MIANGNTALATSPIPILPEAVEQALVNGNLANLTPAQRVVLYKQTCDSLALNPLTTPFQYITLNGKLVLYATRNCTDQLRKVHNVDVAITSRERLDDIYVVTAQARLPNGRTDEEIGAVAVLGLKGEALANAMMKAGTKAKRRVTLSIVGLSLLDETEVETIPGARAFSESDSAPAPEARQLAAPASRVQASPGTEVAATTSTAARAPVSAPGGGATLPIRTASEFFAAAHGLLGGNRGQVAQQVVALLGQEAGAFKAAHPELATWSQVFDVLVGRYEDREQAGQAPPFDAMATAWPDAGDEGDPDAEDDSEAVQAMRADLAGF